MIDGYTCMQMFTDLKAHILASQVSPLAISYNLGLLKAFLALLSKSSAKFENIFCIYWQQKAYLVLSRLHIN